jgi:hypothetical protein
MSIGEGGAAPESRELLKDVLSYALEVMEPSQVGPYFRGAAAYDACIAAFLDDGQFPPQATLPLLMERQMCYGDVFTMIAEGRYTAGMFFWEAAEKFPDNSCALKELSLIFRKIHEKAWEMAGAVPPFNPEESARLLVQREKRLVITDILKQCRTLEEQARGQMDVILKNL